MNECLIENKIKLINQDSLDFPCLYETQQAEKTENCALRIQITPE